MDLGDLVIPARQHDDGDGRVALADLAQKIQAFQIGKAEIQDHKVGLGVELLQGSARAGRLQHLVTLRIEAHAQKLADGGLVVDHEQAERCCVHAAVSSCRAAGASGRVMVKTAPLRSERLPATMRPCIASMNPRETARPRPVPARTVSSFCTR